MGLFDMITVHVPGVSFQPPICRCQCERCLTGASQKCLPQVYVCTYV